ncbi:MAG TPA: CDP-alcohol phosphatidyltransferase family protein [Mycobacteriales bacterium]|nr:CDP-alcohol phosphatidyltransferase family protein [Mycobacteriales bacterium]
MSPPSAERTRPSLEELRAIVHPPALVEDVSREHWMGRLYMRRVSLHFTRALIPTRATPDGLTWLMVVSGLAAALVLTVPSAWSDFVAVALIQLQLLCDCSDGELARWRQWSSPRGIYLDRFGHYTTDAAVVCAVGVHADGGLGSIGGWTTLGLLGAVLVLVSRAETDLVHVARAYVGLPRFEPTAVAPQVSGIRRLRRLAYAVPINRLLLAWDLSVVLVAVAVVDLVAGSTVGHQVLAVVLAVVGVLVCLLHLLTILTSARLR